MAQERTAIKSKSSVSSQYPHGLSADELKAMYEGMVLTRAYDERGFKLQRQGRIGFYAGSFGEEATQIGTAFALEEKDWVFSSYRQPGVAFIRGVPLEVMANNLYGNSQDIVHGRQMPVHYTYRKAKFLSISSVIGTQIIQAVGCAMAARIKGDDAVAITYFGDGGTSSNDFHSGMTFAGSFKAPCVFVLVNNQYAISMPVARQSGCENMAEKASGYGMHGEQVDGNDILAVYAATKTAVERGRQGQGPTLLELKTYRTGPHSSSDDPSRYRDQAETDEWLKRDPIATFRARLEEFGLWNQAYEDELQTSVQERISNAVKQAEALPAPEWDTLFDDVYAEMPQTLQMQKADILAHEQDLDLSNEGEFPL